MTEFLTLFVLIIFIGGFIVKFGELFVALAKVVSYFAIPLSIAGVIFLLSKLFQEVIYARFYELAWQWLANSGLSCFGQFQDTACSGTCLACMDITGKCLNRNIPRRVSGEGVIRSHSTLSG